MPTTPAARAISAERSDDQSEAAWKSRRWVSSRTSTARATSDSSTSAAAMRWSTMVPDSRTTATRHARRWPRRMPRPRATRASPAMAIRAPAASLARRGRYSSTTCSRPRSGGVMASSRSMTPAKRMAADAHRRTRRTRAVGQVGGRGRGATTGPSGTRPPGSGAGSGCRGPGRDEPLQGAGRAQLVAAQQQADVQFGAGLELDPADPLVVEEDRGEPQAAAVLLHHLAGGPHVGVEAQTQMGELGLEGGGGDQSGIPPADQPAAGVAGGVVGPSPRSGRSPGPRPRGSTTSGGSGGRGPGPARRGRPGPRRRR